MAPKLHSFALALCLALPLGAQSYQTSFAAQTFDRSKGPATVHGGAEVDAATGAVSLHIPMGPGIGARGAVFQPALMGRTSPQLQGGMASSSSGPYQTLTDMHEAGFTFTPGTLDLALSGESFGNNDQDLVVSNYSLPGGGSGTLNVWADNVGPVPQASDVTTILHQFSLDAGWGPSFIPWEDNSPTSVSLVRRDSEGGLVIGLVNPQTLPETTLIDAKDIKLPLNGSFPQGYYLWHIPTRVLVVRGSVAYEYQYASPYYQLSTDGDPAQLGYSAKILRSAHYVLSKIRNRFGDTVAFTYPDPISYTATWTQGGAPAGPALTATWTQESVNPDQGQQLGYFTITYQGVSPAPSFALHASLIPARQAPQDFRLNVTPSSLVFNATGEAIGFQWNPGPAVSYNNDNSGPVAPSVLTQISFPTHTLAFSWQPMLYLPNVGFPGVWAGYFPNWGVYVPSWAYGVVRVDDTDLATGTVYTTTHTRVIPAPDLTTLYHWTSRDFYDAITHPDGSVTVERFMEPVEGSAGGIRDTVASQMQSLAFIKHMVRETRLYAPGQYTAADLANPATSSAAYRVTTYDRWDLHGVGDPSGSFTYCAVPSATRSQTWDRDTQVLATQERTDWDAVNLGWTHQHSQTQVMASPSLTFTADDAHLQSLANTGAASGYPGAGTSHQVVNRTFTSDLSTWRLGEEATAQTVVDTDATGFLSGYLPLNLPQVATQRDTLGRVTSQTQGTTSVVTTAFAYKSAAAGSAAASQLDHVDVTGTPDLTVPTGGYGVSAYAYDSLGFLSSITPKGAAWSLAQTQDGFGRPLTQTDANGHVVNIGWDASGRLQSLTPQTGDQATGISYNDTDHRGATVTRGAQQTVYRYDGMERLALIRRFDGAGTATHKVFSYDLAGRRTFESVWLTGAGADTDGLSNTGITGDRYAYDGRGRLTDHTDPNGILTHTDYAGLSRTVTVSTPGKPDSVSTTFTTDALGRLVTVSQTAADPVHGIAAHPLTTVYKYDGAGRVTRVDQYDGLVGAATSQTRTWAYHELGWLQTLNQPESGTTTYSAFTVAGKPQTTSYAGRAVTTTYDALMRPLTVTSADGTVDQAFQYDAASGHGAAMNTMWYARDKGIEQSFTYGDSAGRLTTLATTVWTGGAVNSGTARTFPQSFTYDAYGHRTSAQAGHTVAATAYDLARDLPMSVQRNGTLLPVATVATVDPNSWAVTQLKYGNGASTLYSYDKDQARLVTTSHYTASGGSPLAQWTYGYDGVGRLTGDGEDGYSYDTIGRLTQAVVKRLDGAGTVTQDFAYDAFGNATSSVASGNLPSATAAGANLNSFTLTASEQASLGTTNQLPADTTTGANYDAQGNLLTVFAQTGQAGSQLSFTYDALGRVMSLSDAKRPGVTEAYAYTAGGLRTLVQVSQNGTLQTRRYNLYNDARQLVSQYEEAVSGGTTATRTATRTTSLAVVTDPLAPDILTPAPGVTVQVNTSVSFWGQDDNYPNANLSWNFGDGTAIVAGAKVSHTYAATGTYTIKLMSALSGMASKSITQTLIVAATPPPPPVITAFKAATDGVAPGGADTLTWTVSGATNLSVDQGVGAVTGTSKAVMLGSSTMTYTLTATNAGGSTTAQVTVIVDPLLTSLTWKRDLVYLGGKEVAEYDSAGMHVTHEDHLGSPRFITNAAGSVESRQKYLPFGETLDAALPGTYAPGRGFTNHEQTDASGAIYMQARYYLPQWHRFTAPDPARDQHFEQTQSWNIYSYVQNDPTMRVDPTGMLAFRAKYDEREASSYTVTTTPNADGTTTTTTTYGDSAPSPQTSGTSAQTDGGGAKKDALSLGSPKFGIGIEAPDASAVSKDGVLNVAKDTGHTFAYIKDENGKIVGMISFGPGQPIDPGPGGNKDVFKSGNLPGNAHWPLSGNVNTWETSITAAQMKTGLAAMADFKANTPNYTPGFQCTSAALSVASKMGLSLPSGVSQVIARAWGVTVFNQNVANPYGLGRDMTSRYGSPMVVPSSSFPIP